MKIIEGLFAGTQIQYKEQKGTRVTSEKVRKSVFDVLKNLIDPSTPFGAGFDGLNIADLFCGSGMYGIEAISRGARSVTFVDDSKEVTGKLKRNLEEIKKKFKILDTRYLILNIRYDKFVKSSNEKFDLVFADPPYYDFDFEKLNNIYKILSADGILVLESSKRIKAIEPFELKLIVEKKYGDALVRFYKNGRI
jgi:16S rRNA (guanine966-N2)-methyltransferase